MSSQNKANSMRHSIFIVFYLITQNLHGQINNIRLDYQNAYDKINNAIVQNRVGGFKDAVFYVENVCAHDTIEKTKFDNIAFQYASLCEIWAKTNSNGYLTSDSVNFYLNIAIFKLMKDTIKIALDSLIMKTLPFEYDFDDFEGKKDWNSMFVTKLLKTHKGNCHSLPYLYKIIADELGAKCWLALAPNHIYIKNYSKKDGWYNTELTTGDFPIDAWLSASGYIPLQALQNGLYCDTLSNQQTIALCLLDLAKGYEKRTKNYYDGFMLQCCDKVLQYHQMNAKAMLLRAETLKRVYEKQKKENSPEASDTYDKMEQQYLTLYDLGYREMPEKMYKDWLMSVMQQREKYGNKVMTIGRNK